MFFELIGYLGVALATACGSWGIARWAHRRGAILAVPNARSSHTIPTPSGGGLVMAASFWLGLLVLFGMNRLDPELFIALLVGSLMLVTVGIVDDIFEVKRRWRLLCQAGAACWALYWLAGVTLWAWPGFWWVQQLLVAIALVWLINLYNFMDGIDGLAASEAIYVTLASLVLIKGHTEVALVLPLLAAVCAGFLLLNWPPARIFMGDSGSYLLGYVIGVCGLAIVKEQLLTGWALLILLAVFLIDATYTLLRRIINRAHWYEPHRSHAYQKAACRFGGHAIVTVGVLILNLAWLLPWAWLAGQAPEWGAGIALLAMLPLVLLAHRLGAGNEHDKIY